MEYMRRIPTDSWCWNRGHTAGWKKIWKCPCTGLPAVSARQAKGGYGGKRGPPWSSASAVGTHCAPARPGTAVTACRRPCCSRNVQREAVTTHLVRCLSCTGHRTTSALQQGQEEAGDTALKEAP